jgi:ADP-heptose:LPS heptosyltransferase
VKIHVLSTPVGCEVLKMAPPVDRAIVFPLRKPSPPWWRHWGILRDLRRQRYDVALSFSGSDRNIFITAISGARLKLVHDDGRPHWWRTWLVPTWVSRRSRLLPMFEQRRQVLAHLGFNLGAPAFNLCVDPGEFRWAESSVPEQTLHFSVNASSHIKEWPLSHWVELATSSLGELPGHSIVATASGAPREQQRLREFVAALKPGDRSRLITFPQALSIPRLAAVLQRCQLHVGADSGVLHLAMALGVPTVSIFRDYEGLQEWQPQGSLHRSVVRHCSCEATKSWGPECQTRARCLAQIPPGEVKPLIHELLSTRKTQHQTANTDSDSDSEH